MKRLAGIPALLVLAVLTASCVRPQIQPEALETLSRNLHAHLLAALTDEERARLGDVTFDYSVQSRRLSAAAMGRHFQVTNALVQGLVSPTTGYLPFLEQWVRPDLLQPLLAESYAQDSSLNPIEREILGFLGVASTAFVIAHEISHLLDDTTHQSVESAPDGCGDYPFCMTAPIDPIERRADRFAVDLVQRAGLPPVPFGLASVFIENAGAFVNMIGRLDTLLKEDPSETLDGPDLLQQGIARTQVIIDVTDEHCNAMRVAEMRMKGVLEDLRGGALRDGPDADFYRSLLPMIERVSNTMSFERERCFVIALLTVENLHLVTLEAVMQLHSPDQRAAAVSAFEARYAASLAGGEKTTWALLRRSLLGGPDEQIALLTAEEGPGIITRFAGDCRRYVPPDVWSLCPPSAH